MQRRWHYIYVILYPDLGYKFYYGSRITARHPDEDIRYFGSLVTFKHYNDDSHEDYQPHALKVILWAAKLPHCKKSARRLSELETQYIRDALKNSEHLGPEVCLNRNYAGRIVLTPEEHQARQQRISASIIQKYAKTYTFIDPRGRKVTFTNLKQFCRDHNLHRSHMRSVHKGTRNSHKGWTKP
jgi:hypothetical protein